MRSSPVPPATRPSGHDASGESCGNAAYTVMAPRPSAPAVSHGGPKSDLRPQLSGHCHAAAPRQYRRHRHLLSHLHSVALTLRFVVPREGIRSTDSQLARRQRGTGDTPVPHPRRMGHATFLLIVCRRHAARWLSFAAAVAQQMGRMTHPTRVWQEYRLNCHGPLCCSPPQGMVAFPLWADTLRCFGPFRPVAGESRCPSKSSPATMSA